MCLIPWNDTSVLSDQTIFHSSLHEFSTCFVCFDLPIIHSDLWTNSLISSDDSLGALDRDINRENNGITFISEGTRWTRKTVPSSQFNRSYGKRHPGE